MRASLPAGLMLCLLVLLTACTLTPAPEPESTALASYASASPTVPLQATQASPLSNDIQPSPPTLPALPSHSPPPAADRSPSPTAPRRLILATEPYPSSTASPQPPPAQTHEPEETDAAAPLPTVISSGAEARPWRIMPLGDSLTSGNYPGRVHSYRGYLETLLSDAGYPFDFVGTQSRLAHGGTDPDHEGHSGFSIGPDNARFCEGCSTANLYDHLEDYLQSEPDIILMLVGINDLLPLDVRPVDPADAPSKLASLVQRLQKLRPTAYIFVASLAPINYMDNANLPYYDEVNQAAEQLGANPDDRVFFVDLNRILQSTLDRQTDFADGVHLAEGGARKMAQVWFDALVSSGLLAHPAP